MSNNDYDTKTDASSRSPGGTDHYFGGSDGTPDGPGHGHIVTDANGDVVYAREAAQELPGSSRSDRVSVDKK